MSASCYFSVPSSPELAPPPLRTGSIVVALPFTCGTQHRPVLASLAKTPSFRELYRWITNHGADLGPWSREDSDAWPDAATKLQGGCSIEVCHRASRTATSLMVSIAPSMVAGARALVVEILAVFTSNFVEFWPVADAAQPPALLTESLILLMRPVWYN